LRDDENDDDSLSEEELENLFLQQMQRTVNITLGAIIAYINSDVFDELSEDQKDYVFEYVIDSWAMLLPFPVDAMWQKQIQLLALTQQIRKLAEQKRQQSTVSKEETMKIIYDQLGWDFEKGEFRK
jgi:hypothetical protein